MGVGARRGGTSLRFVQLPLVFFVTFATPLSRSLHADRLYDCVGRLEVSLPFGKFVTKLTCFFPVFRLFATQFESLKQAVRLFGEHRRRRTLNAFARLYFADLTGDLLGSSLAKGSQALTFLVLSLKTGVSHHQTTVLSRYPRHGR